MEGNHMADGEDIREPVTKILEEQGGARLIVELPGVSQDSIKMGVSGDILKLDAEGKQGKFSTVQVVPFEPDPERISVTFTQGVLEVGLRKKDEGSQKEDNREGEELSISLDSMEKELESLRAELKVVSDEKESLEERVTFLQKDFQNIKRRHEGEKESLADRKVSEIANGLIDVLDSFRFAKESIRSSASGGGGVESMVKGVEMVENQVLNLFNRVGIKIIISEGQHFDPNFHEAIGYVENPDLEDEVVANEVKRGYLYKGKALRPAQVMVNRKPETQTKGKGKASKKKDKKSAK